MRTLVAGSIVPRPGDLVLARVDQLGHHKRVERPTGRFSKIFPGDEIIVCLGDRYAPDQFEAEMPVDLSPCHLVAGGGVASRALAWHDRLRGPTEITPIGLVGDAQGRPINVRDYALPHLTPPAIPAIAVVGTSMNSGKTTTVMSLVRGLTAEGHKVGTVKLTGTGSGNDFWIMQDAGAHAVRDFTDAGFASTYRVPLAEIERGMEALFADLAATGCTVIVAEVADGLFQQETAGLVQSATFRRLVTGLVFAAGEAMGAVAGVAWLSNHGLKVNAISGVMSQSPLAMTEAQRATGLACLSRKSLEQPGAASPWLNGRVSAEPSSVPHARRGRPANGNRLLNAPVTGFSKTVPPSTADALAW